MLLVPGGGGSGGSSGGPAPASSQFVTHVFLFVCRAKALENGPRSPCFLPRGGPPPRHAPPRPALLWLCALNCFSFLPRRWLPGTAWGQAGRGAAGPGRGTQVLLTCALFHVPCVLLSQSACPGLPRARASFGSGRSAGRREEGGGGRIVVSQFGASSALSPQPCLVVSLLGGAAQRRSAQGLLSEKKKRRLLSFFSDLSSLTQRRVETSFHQCHAMYII